MAIKVFVVDDSLFFRKMLTDTFASDDQIQIIGTAGDPYEASEKIPALNPDVVTLDVEMPRMDGITFLKKLIPQYPVPVVVISAAPIKAFDALDAGAVDYVKKPLIKSPNDMKSFAAEMRNKIVIASNAKVRQFRSYVPAPQYTPSNGNLAKPDHVVPKTVTYTNRNTLIAIGASTGGTDALQTALLTMPAGCPPIVIVQHMPPVFTKMFAERLDKICQIQVVEAKNGDRCKPGVALLAEGSAQLRVMKDATGYYVKVGGTEKVSGHCPSVDVMFDSVADCAGANAIGVILTGMGSDGAAGMKKMRDKGAYNIGQDKDSCVVYGMPMVAYNMGGVNIQVPLVAVTGTIVKKFSGK